MGEKGRGYQRSMRVVSAIAVLNGKGCEKQLTVRALKEGRANTHRHRDTYIPLAHTGYCMMRERKSTITRLVSRAVIKAYLWAWRPRLPETAPAVADVPPPWLRGCGPENFMRRTHKFQHKRRNNVNAVHHPDQLAACCTHDAFTHSSSPSRRLCRLFVPCARTLDVSSWRMSSRA